MSRITRILLIFCLAASPLRAYDRHNTGGFSSAEHACGDPFIFKFPVCSSRS